MKFLCNTEEQNNKYFEKHHRIWQKLAGISINSSKQDTYVFKFKEIDNKSEKT